MGQTAFEPNLGISIVMPGTVPGIHALAAKLDVDGRDEPGHDAFWMSKLIMR